MAETSPTYCTRHPRVESRLACNKCGTVICPRCLVQTPVGARCPECAQLRRLPTFDIDPLTLAKAMGTGIVLAGVTGLTWGLVFFDLVRVPHLSWAVTIGIGYAIGEGISVVSNRKRGRVLQCIAGAGMVLSYVVAGIVSPLVFVFTFPDFLFLLVLVIGVFVAAGRVG